MKFAIVITCYNKECFVGDAIRSSLGQGAEIFVVDDFSTDRSRSVIANFPGAIALMHTRNLGATAATRTGVDAAVAAGADQVILLDGDDVLAPDAVEWYREVVTRYDADVVFPGVRRLPDRDCRGDATPCDRNLPIRLEDDPMGYWLAEGYISGPVCGQPGVLISSVDPGNVIQDFEIAYSAHLNARRIAYSQTVTHYCSMAVPGQNLSMELRKKIHGYTRLFLRVWPAVKDKQYAANYARRAFRRCLWAYKLHRDIGLRGRLILKVMANGPKSRMPLALCIAVISWVHDVTR